MTYQSKNSASWTGETKTDMESVILLATEDGSILATEALEDIIAQIIPDAFNQLKSSASSWAGITKS